MAKRLFFLIILATLDLQVYSQSLGVDISSPSTVCINQNVEIINNSTNVDSLNWDLCTGDLSLDLNIINTFQPTNDDFIYGMDFVKSGNVWVGFTCGLIKNQLYRVLIDEGFNSIIGFEVVGDLNDVINQPQDVSILKYSDSFFVYVNNRGANRLVRLDMGSSLLGDISSVPGEVLDASSGTVNGGGMGLLVDNEMIQIFLTDANGISSYSLYDDPTHIPVPADIYRSNGFSNYANGGDIEFFQIEDGSWYGFSVGINSNSLIRLEYSLGYLADPTVVDITTAEFSSVRPYGVSVIPDGNDYYIIAFSIEGPIVKVNLGENITNDPINDSKINDSYRNLLKGIFVKDQSTNYLVTANWSSNEIYIAQFDNANCESVPQSSSDFDLEPFQYSTEGERNLTIRMIDQFGEIINIKRTLDVNSQTAPDPTFSSDACISSPITFTPMTSGLTYSWDFDGDGLEDSDLETPEFAFASTGTYTVRLDVSDGTCNNFYEQEITIYDPPPAPSYTYSSAQTCINADFTFTNTTTDGAYTGPLEYLWEFIDEPSGTVVATATTKDAVYAFETEGQKTVRLTSSIPGCTEVTEQTLMITPGPTANFFAASVCQNEAMQFTNTSSDAISYSWDFGDGFMSTATNPSHIFTGAGNFFVTLTATDAEGCEDSEVIEVAVSDSPQINFDFDIPCTSADGIQFYDLTTVDNADLVSWTWFVDDVEVSTAQSPQIVFGSTGIKNIRLVVGSSNGCESSYSEDVEVLTAPSPDFTFNVGCQGESSSFIDITPSTGNPIVSWLWTIDGVNYGTQDADHIFNDAGTFDVTLEVTGQNFCSETITKSVEIIELPTVDFSIIGECDNQLIEATDQSTASADPVIARRWRLDGINVGNGAQLVLENLSNDTYDLELELETQGGCVISSAQSIVINDAPESSFSSSRTYGIPNDQLTFTNTSTGGSSFQWLLDGEVRSMDPQTESITFSSSGTFLVSLVSQNSLGCYDTATQEILIAVPEVDLAIGSFEIVNENGTGKIFLEVQNFSNLPVEIVDVQIVLANTFAITEQVVGFIDVGSTSLISLNAGIPLTVSEPSYFCAKLSSQYVGYPDIEPVNNEKCITIDPIIKVEDPFPNPVTDQFRLKLIVNDAGSANISLLNSAGKVQLSSVKNVTEGLNNYFIDMSLLNPGIYYVVVDVMGTTHKKKVIKL